VVARGVNCAKCAAEAKATAVANAADEAARAARLQTAVAKLASCHPVFPARTRTALEAADHLVDVVAAEFAHSTDAGKLVLQRVLSALGDEVDRPKVAGTTFRLRVRAPVAAGGAASTPVGTSQLGVALDAAMRSPNSKVLPEPVVVCVCGSLSAASAATVGNNQAPDSGSPVLAAAAAAIADMASRGQTTSASGALREAASNALALSHWLTDLLGVGVGCCICGVPATVCCPQCRPSTPAFCADHAEYVHAIAANKHHAVPIPLPAGGQAVPDAESNRLLWAGHEHAEVLRVSSSVSETGVCTGAKAHDDAARLNGLAQIKESQDRSIAMGAFDGDLESLAQVLDLGGGRAAEETTDARIVVILSMTYLSGGRLGTGYLAEGPDGPVVVSAVDLAGVIVAFGERQRRAARPHVQLVLACCAGETLARQIGLVEVAQTIIKPWVDIAFFNGTHPSELMVDALYALYHHRWDLQQFAEGYNQSLRAWIEEQSDREQARLKTAKGYVYSDARSRTA
jgi:hypothetical protein